MPFLHELIDAQVVGEAAVLGKVSHVVSLKFDEVSEVLSIVARVSAVNMNNIMECES